MENNKEPYKCNIEMCLERVSSLVTCGFVPHSYSVRLAVGRASDVDGVERFDKLHSK